ncbi:nuclear transport factor 2 family protein [Actinomadura rudentiformis]|uniref:Nuclear transport factor 2 family protein n=1 Tax=Actinomadura rudentiformis TaxID=359158 RepID=A0A6H9YNV7_9ACTN|nr:nuclear transport factor 2 family protein [Actinomadura rudentiformis]KAB2341580.1 nuclear transport factor 2 family protein [Actinomadura rudentiformis]
MTGNELGTAITLSAVDRLLAIEEIKTVFAERLRCMDSKEWEIYPTLHTDDVVSETFGVLPPEKRPSSDGERRRVTGKNELTATIRGLLDGPIPLTTVHHGHAPIIELTSDTTARGVWAMEDHLWWTNGDREEHLHGYGHYHEEYRQVGDRWLISYRNLSRLREDRTPGFYDFLERP